MAFFQCNFHAETLGMETSVNVIYPQHRAASTQIGMKSGTDFERPPVLYLLHGQSDDQTIWMRRTSIERYAADYGIAVVMPNGHRSYYCNLANGMRFWDFMSQELPELIAGTFQVSTKREDTFVAGLSMGGFGALRLALRCPQNYAAVAALSAVIRPEWLKDGNNDMQLKTYQDAFGNAPVENSEFDLFHLAEQLKTANHPAPQFYLVCGSQDAFLQDNQRFATALEENNFNAQFHIDEGNHSWQFWDKHIQNVLKWLPINHTL